MAERGIFTPMAHLICVAHTRAELVEILEAYASAGVVNLMALGGDPPTHDGAVTGELTYAEELVALAREVGEFSIGVAAHPGGHPRSPSLASDREHLARKLQLADFAVTQLLFEAADWSGLVAELATMGVTKPVLPGIMPVTSLNSIPRMAAMGSAVPEWMVEALEAAHEHGGDAAVRETGISLATDLCRELLTLGVPGLHFYTLNLSTATREITERLGWSPENT
jgi:methylenetetrahydrofolate reductase (NADPH)